MTVKSYSSPGPNSLNLTPNLILPAAHIDFFPCCLLWPNDNWLFQGIFLTRRKKPWTRTLVRKVRAVSPASRPGANSWRRKSEDFPRRQRCSALTMAAFSHRLGWKTLVHARILCVMQASLRDAGTFWDMTAHHLLLVKTRCSGTAYWFLCGFFCLASPMFYSNFHQDKICQPKWTLYNSARPLRCFFLLCIFPCFRVGLKIKKVNNSIPQSL